MSLEKMFARLRRLFEKQNWNCVSRYGVPAEIMLIAALKTAPPNTLFEVSEENAEEYRARYLSWVENKSMAFALGGVVLRINDGLIATFEKDLVEKLVSVPEVYCLVHDTGFLLSVINQVELVDFNKEFEERLSAVLNKK